jgi:hypothetical protein
MESAAMTCGVCGRGKLFSSATFGTGTTRVRWSMWFCGHTYRAAVGDDDLDGAVLEVVPFASRGPAEPIF